MGGKFHLKLNIGSRPIANKYHEGKMKRTLKRELKVPEIAEREANGTSASWRDCTAVLIDCRIASAQALQWVLIMDVRGCLAVSTSSSGSRKTQGTW